MKRKSDHRLTGKSLLSRRVFLKRAAAGSAYLAVLPAAGYLPYPENWQADAHDYKIHMIGQAHIDPVWLWPWTEGLSVVHSTFRSALDRMNENPDFKFTASSAQFYQWVADNDPDMSAEIRQRIEEGRWNIVGGWWVEPDVNIPCGESLVRQGLYGQLTFRKLFGRYVIIAFNPDSFGHTGTLPQILKQQGMERYVFMRPMPNEKKLPADLFMWEGSDGTSVLTYRIPLSYNDTGSVKERIQQVLSQFRNEPMKEYMVYYGAGDHGGGATKENIRSIEELKSQQGAPVIIYSTPEIYFREISQYKNLNIPTVRDDLQHHSRGCYTAESGIKKGNRTAEAALITAEKITSVGSAIWGCSCPRDEFTSAWKRVLLMQFHDSMAGTSVPEHSVTAREAYDYAVDTANQAMYMAVQKLAWQVPSEDPESQYLFVFNPHPWNITENIEYDIGWDQTNISQVEDGEGNPVQYQWAPGSTETGNRKRLVARVPLPAFGYCQIRVLKKENKQGSGTIARDNLLENDYLRVTFSDKGTISILEKESGKQVFANGGTGARAVIIDDPSDTWSHDVTAFSKEIGSFGNASVKILETGPLRGVIRVISNYGKSNLSIDWILYAGSRNLEARITLDWHEHLKMLKFSFPVQVQNPVATYEIPFGSIVRNTNGDEEPGQRWIDLSGRRNGKDFGLTVINDAKYGYSVNGNDLQVSIARSAVYAHHKPRVLDMNKEHIWQDQGIQTLRILLIPHNESWQKSNIIRYTEQFIASAPVIYQGIHSGTRPQSDSFLAIDAENIIISAIKQSETNDDIIIRCVEASGIPVSANLNIHFAGKQWTGTFRPYEIKTLRMNRRTGKITEVSLLEE